MNLTKKSVFIFLCILMFLSSCSRPKPYAKISVSETNGLSRQLEYVTAKIPFQDLKPTHLWIARNYDTDESISVQVLDTVENEGNSYLKFIFPIKIDANSTKNFELIAEEKIKDVMPFSIEYSKDDSSVENQIYKASFNTKYDKRGGVIDNIVLKNINNTRLKRGHISMHWAPNFTKTDVKGNYNMKDLPADSENSIKKGQYQITKKRSGITEKVPEIYVEGSYTFFANVPYFFFESTMTMKNDVSLKLLRNDEMTIDSLFTHVAYQKNDGSLKTLELYTSELDTLENNPIPDNSRFVAFYNANYKYGLASIRLEYDNTHADGNASPTRNPHTKISKSRNNGRYWNRVLIDSATTTKKGSRYHEKNAYLIFEANEELPEEQILYYTKRLMHPLKITLTK